VTLEFFNFPGRKTDVLVDSKQKAGHHADIQNSKDKLFLVYFYKITASDFTETKKMVLVK
jgi:hypothetical protein